MIAIARDFDPSATASATPDPLDHEKPEHLRLTIKAVREDWPMAPDRRAQALESLGAILASESPKIRPRMKLLAARAILQFEDNEARRAIDQTRLEQKAQQLENDEKHREFRREHAEKSLEHKRAELGERIESRKSREAQWAAEFELRERRFEHTAKHQAAKLDHERELHDDRMAVAHARLDLGHARLDLDKARFHHQVVQTEDKAEAQAELARHHAAQETFRSQIANYLTPRTKHERITSAPTTPAPTTAAPATSALPLRSSAPTPSMREAKRPDRPSSIGHPAQSHPHAPAA
jgi:hypothetical protein